MFIFFPKREKLYQATMNFIRNYLNFSLLIILKLNLFTLVASRRPPPPPISPINVICGLDVGSQIKQLPKGCTSIAKYASNLQTSSDDIFRLRGKLPYVYIADDLSYDKIYKKLKPTNVQQYLSEWTMKIQGDNINVVVFQNFYPDENDDVVDNNFQRNLRVFLLGIIQSNPGILISLVIPNDQSLMRNAFNIAYIDELVNFYVVDTTKYNKCTKRRHQAEMAIIAPVDKIELSVCTAKDLGYPFNKMMYIIRVVVKSTIFGEANDDEDESYQFLCSDEKAGKIRKYCTDTLENFYSKGQLVKTYGLKGVLIISVDRDDSKNSCTVGEFPVTQCIMAGVRGLKDPKKLTSNPSFGLLPRDRKKTKTRL